MPSSTSRFSRGIKLGLDDGTGRVALVLWHEVYDDCWDAEKLSLGARLRAPGAVAAHEAELQLQSRGARTWASVW
jgi:hypothetical protein